MLCAFYVDHADEKMDALTKGKGSKIFGKFIESD